LVEVRPINEIRVRKRAVDSWGKFPTCLSRVGQVGNLPQECSRFADGHLARDFAFSGKDINMSLKQNLAEAWQAVAFVKAKVKATDKWDDLISAPQCFPIQVWNRMVDRGKGLERAGRRQDVAERAESSGCGNCGEQAAMAFEFLKQKNVFPLDYMTVGHNAIVVIGIPDTGSSWNVADWGKDAVVCDPWHGMAYIGIEPDMRLFVENWPVTPHSLWHWSGPGR
jgi:hypothetical protein